MSTLYPTSINLQNGRCILPVFF